MNDYDLAAARYALTAFFLIALILAGKLDAQIGMAALMGLIFPTGHFFSVVVPPLGPDDTVATGKNGAAIKTAGA